MAKRPIQLAMTLCDAINYKHHCHLVLNTRRFYKGGRMVNLYNIYDSYYTDDGEYISQKLYMSSSSVYICFFLQEVLYALDDKPFPEPTNKGYITSRSSKNVDAAISYILSVYGDDDNGQ